MRGFGTIAGKTGEAFEYHRAWLGRSGSGAAVAGGNAARLSAGSPILTRDEVGRIHARIGWGKLRGELGRPDLLPLASDVLRRTELLGPLPLRV